MRKSDFVLLVEGQIDCISAYMAGIHNVLAISGTAFTEMQARQIARFTKRVIVNFDPDTAGESAAEKSIALLTAEDFEVKIVTLEDGLTPTVSSASTASRVTAPPCAQPNATPTTSSTAPPSVPRKHRRGQGQCDELPAAPHPPHGNPSAATSSLRTPPTSLASTPRSCARSSSRPPPSASPASRPIAPSRSLRPSASFFAPSSFSKMLRPIRSSPE